MTLLEKINAEQNKLNCFVNGAGIFLLNDTETDGILLKGLQGDFIYC